MFKNVFMSALFLLERKLTQKRRVKKTLYRSFPIHCLFLLVGNNYPKQKKNEIVFVLF